VKVKMRIISKDKESLASLIDLLVIFLLVLQFYVEYYLSYILHKSITANLFVEGAKQFCFDWSI